MLVLLFLTLFCLCLSLNTTKLHAVVRIPVVAIFFRKLFFKENFLKIRVKVRAVLGKWRGRGEVEEREKAKYLILWLGEII